MIKAGTNAEGQLGSMLAKLNKGIYKEASR